MSEYNNDDFDNSYEEAILEQKVDLLDPNFIIESIKAQIKNPFGRKKRNYIKKLENQYNDIMKKEDNNDASINVQMDMIYRSIIEEIENAYDISIDMDNYNKPDKIAKHLYQFFVIQIVDSMEQFFETYILEHKDELISELNININKKTELAEDEKIEIIVNHIYDIIINIANLPIEFNEFIDLIVSHLDSSGSAEKIKEYYEDKNIIKENSDLYQVLMKPIIDESEGYTILLNNINMALCLKFVNQ